MVSTAETRAGSATMLSNSCELFSGNSLARNQRDVAISTRGSTVAIEDSVEIAIGFDDLRGARLEADFG